METEKGLQTLFSHMQPDPRCSQKRGNRKLMQMKNKDFFIAFKNMFVDVEGMNSHVSPVCIQLSLCLLQC